MSTLKVDNLLLQNNNAGTGRILETICGMADGRSITTLSGTYSLEEVTTYQALSTTFTDITGSKINYLPPEGTKTVVYKFSYHESYAGNTFVLYHTQLMIDDVEVTKARNTVYLSYMGGKRTFYYAINCVGSSDDSTTGTFTSWTSQKELKLQMREYSSSYNAQLHNTYWWAGAGSQNLTLPMLEITAIG